MIENTSRLPVHGQSTPLFHRSRVRPSPGREHLVVEAEESAHPPHTKPLHHAVRENDRPTREGAPSRPEGGDCLRARFTCEVAHAASSTIGSAGRGGRRWTST
jgi:hypothetical protein